MDSSALRAVPRIDLANAIRALAMDAVQKANSGHPGMPMGMADIAEVLWNDVLRHNPANPKWFNRDRFVVSNGHGSMLLYALLHLSGYELPLEELKNFRQLHSKTPGHPEYGITPGVETTTGPLGQGLANAVGMALAERIVAARFNRPGHELIDHRTFCFVGDGCLMEGISHEACSLAGVLGLGKLVVLYDDNGISIDGEVAGWFLDDTPSRFEAYGWQVVRNVNGHDPNEVRRALDTAQKQQDKPTLICCKTIIGYGAPNKQGTEGVHGAALGADEVAAARKQLNWAHAPFEIPDPIRKAWDARPRGAQLEGEWNAQLARYRAAFPVEALEFERRISGVLPETLHDIVTSFVSATQASGKEVASRKASQNALNAIAPGLPELIGGSADLSESNCTIWSGCHPVKPGAWNQRYISYGVREFGMAAIMNGMALHGAIIPYGGTFLTFTDYARNAIRMAALMKIRTIFICTHDSIGLGEDGPTHQPIEHLASLRLIPGLHVWRPCDAVETAVAWECAIKRADGPTVMALSRQNLPHQARDATQLANVARGGYVLWEAPGTGLPEAIVMSTGSEVGLAMSAAKSLAEKGRRVRVVSMPCCELFRAQDEAYRESVLPHAVTQRLAVEAGVPDSWFRFVGRRGRLLGIESFGESAPAPAVYKALGLTVERVVAELEQFFA